MEEIFRMIFVQTAQWTASIALEREVRRNDDQDKRNDALALLAHAGALIQADSMIQMRAEKLRAASYGAFDGLHLAFAEAAKADVLLTTDDRFLRLAARGLGHPLVRVLNPVNWLREVRHGTH